MVRNSTEYGISRITRNCMAYSDGARFYAYTLDLATGKTDIKQFFRCWAEAQEFQRVNWLYR